MNAKTPDLFRLEPYPVNVAYRHDQSVTASTAHRYWAAAAAGATNDWCPVLAACRLSRAFHAFREDHPSNDSHRSIAGGVMHWMYFWTLQQVIPLDALHREIEINEFKMDIHMEQRIFVDNRSCTIECKTRGRDRRASAAYYSVKLRRVDPTARFFMASTGEDKPDNKGIPRRYADDIDELITFECLPRFLTDLTKRLKK